MPIPEAELKQLAPKVDEARRAAYASLAFLLAGLLFVPIWWRLTTVERQPLPADEINRLYYRQPELQVDLRILSFDPWLEPADLASLERQLLDRLVPSGLDKRRHVQLRYRVSARPATPHETELMRSAGSPGELEEGLQRSAVGGGGVGQDLSESTLTILLLPNASHLLELPASVGGGAGGGSSRRGYVRESGWVYLSSGAGVSEIRDKIERLTSRVLLDTDGLEESYANALGDQRLPSAEAQRQAGAAPAYDIVLSLVHCQPSQRRQLSWDVQEAVRLLLDPFLARLSRYVNLSVRSQVVHHVAFYRAPKRSSDGRHYYYDQSDLPDLLNSLEPYVQSPVSSNPQLHLLVYVPPAGHSPLRLYGQDARMAGVNALVSARWGAVYFYNPPDGDWPEGRHRVNMTEVFAGLLPQLKALLGLRRQLPRIYLPLEPPGYSQVTQLELRHWLRRRSLESAARTKLALRSLVQLLDRVENMVISDRVADQIAASVGALSLALDNLRIGGLTEAFVAAKAALRNSESAFFDHSLLQLLYFPQDQKYAIYVPYFLPVGVSLALSGVAAVRLLRALQQTKTKED